MTSQRTWNVALGTPTSEEVVELAQALEVLRRHYIAQLQQDDTARRRAEAADRFKTEFLGNINHELRTPLNAILGFTEVLLEQIDGPLTEAQREDLETIRSSGQHLQTLFDDILDLSAAASGRLNLRWEDIDVGRLLMTVATELEGQKGVKDIDIVVEVAPDLPRAKGDPKRLRQVLTNLGSNALKFTERGEVRLHARVRDGAMVVQVVDTGAGISQLELAAIFGEYVQGSKEVRHQRGVGLGLAISQRLVELHGGHLTASSRPGQGSRFTLTWPIEDRRP